MKIRSQRQTNHTKYVRLYMTVLSASACLGLNSHCVISSCHVFHSDVFFLFFFVGSKVYYLELESM